MDEDIGDRFANAVKFAFDCSRTPRVVEPSAATSELGRVPGVRPRCVRRVFLVAVGFAVTIAAIAFGHQIWRSFEVRTVVPSPYEIPKFGPTGALLNSLGRHAFRPAHLHLKLSHDRFEPLNTQVYFSGDRWLESDVADAVKGSLITKLEKRTEPAELRKRDFDRPYFVVSYDFVLQPWAG